MPTPNLGLVVLVGGTTPGALNNTTPGTYPYIEAANLNLIDSLCYSLNNKVPTAGLNITADLPLNGFNLLNALGINAVTLQPVGAGTLTIGPGGGVLNISSVTTLGVTTLGVTGLATFGSSSINKITLAGAAAGVDPTITVTGDATRNLNVIVPAAANSIAGLSITPTGGNSPMFLGSQNVAGQAALWLGYSGTTATAANYALLYSTSNGICQINANNTVALSIAGTAYLQLLTTAVYLSGIPIQQNNPATPLSVKGNAAAAAGVGVVLDNVTSQTSGLITSFRTAGVEKANIDFQGNVNLKGGAVYQINTATSLGLVGNAAAAGVSVILDNGIALGSTGRSLQISNNGVLQWGVSSAGHTLPLSGAPAAPIYSGFAAGYQSVGQVTGISVTGGDDSFILTFTAGTGVAAIPAGTLICTITLASAFQSLAFNAFASYHKLPSSAPAYTTFMAIPTAVNTIGIYNVVAFTPTISELYQIGIKTEGAGATY